MYVYVDIRQYILCARTQEAHQWLTHTHRIPRNTNTHTQTCVGEGRLHTKNSVESFGTSILPIVDQYTDHTYIGSYTHTHTLRDLPVISF